MMKRPFFGLAKPKVEYDADGAVSAPTAVPVPDQVTCLVDVPYEKKDQLLINSGQAVQAGQKLVPMENSPAYAVAPLGGTIAQVSAQTGNFGRKYTAVTITADAGAAVDPSFQAAAQTPTLDQVKDHLQFVPGGLPAGLFTGDGQLNTLVVCGADEDLLAVTRQSVLKNNLEGIKKGLEVLKKVSGAERIVLTAPEALVASARSVAVEVKGIGRQYPAANPRLIARDQLGKTIAAGRTPEAEGICFISAEAVVAVGQAYHEGLIPQQKIITVVGKDGQRKLVSALLGTPVKDVLAATGVTVNGGDRVILGGPLTGQAIYTEAAPVVCDTDMILVQAADQIPPICDRACINCGECVRMCPARIPVNILIRYLDAGQYSEAADNCDLLACIECGLCSFVCPAQIPIFQYITLGKYEFARENAVEADNA